MAASWTGLEQLTKMIENLQKLPEDLGQELEDRIKQKTPVRSGNLQRSITHTVSNGIIDVGTDAVYAPEVEFGTEHEQPVGMFGTTVLETPDIIEQLIKR